MHSKPTARIIFIAGIMGTAIFLSLLFTMNSCRDSCQDIVCQNGADCIDGSCDCPDGYSGSDCSKNVSANYLGTYNVSEVCPNITTYTVNVGVDSLNLAQVRIANFFNLFSNLVIANVDNTSITIPFQSPDGDGKTVSGSGSFIPPNQINWNYTVYDGTATINCSNSVWSK